MTLHLTLTFSQAFALRDALASAARQPSSHELALDPLWEAVIAYCEQRLHTHPHPTALQP